MTDSALSDYEIHRAWYCCAPLVWKLLAAGYGWLLFSIVIDWKVTSAGGLLAGVCIAAEIFLLDSPLQKTINNTKKDNYCEIKYQQDRIQFHVNYDDSFKRAKIRESNGAERTVSINTNIGVWVYSGNIRASLYRIATVGEKEFNYSRITPSGEITKAQGWAHNETSSRVRRRINILIGASAILGTIVWAYFPSACECA